MDAHVTGPRINPPIYDLESPLRNGRPVLFLVVHTAECGEVDGADDAVSRYLARMSGASIHASIDNNSITPSVPEDRVAWAASNPKINNYALQVEWIGRADQGEAGWDDQFSRDQMRVGAWLYARWAREHGIPVRHGSVEDLRAGRPGFYGHIDSTRAWNNADGHYDPGPTFPWDHFLDMVRAELAPEPADEPQEDDVVKIMWTKKGSQWARDVAKAQPGREQGAYLVYGSGLIRHIGTEEQLKKDWYIGVEDLGVCDDFLFENGHLVGPGSMES